MCQFARKRGDSIFFHEKNIKEAARLDLICKSDGAACGYTSKLHLIQRCSTLPLQGANCQQHPFAEKSFSHDFFWIETPENFETETAPSFLDSLHLEEAESNTFESDAACKCFAKFVMQPGFTDNMPVMPNPPAAVDVGAIVTEVVRQLRG